MYIYILDYRLLLLNTRILNDVFENINLINAIVFVTICHVSEIRDVKFQYTVCSALVNKVIDALLRFVSVVCLSPRHLYHSAFCWNHGTCSLVAGRPNPVSAKRPY